MANVIIDTAEAATIAYNEKNWDKARAVLVEKAIYDEKATGRRLHGVNQIIDAWQGWAKAIPDSKATFVVALFNHLIRPRQRLRSEVTSTVEPPHHPSMDRRRFLLTSLASALAAPFAADAQQVGKVWRIGVLETTSPSLNTTNLEAFRQGLRELGYVEGRNVVIEYRSADGRPERFPSLASELVRLKVDLIVTRGTPAVLAAKNATGSIPIVMATSADPAGFGVVSGLARPGANVTGLSTIAVELAAKRLELLKEAIPRIARIAELANMSRSASASQWRQIEVAARSLGLEPQLLDVRAPADLLALLTPRPINARRPSSSRTTL